MSVRAAVRVGGPYGEQIRSILERLDALHDGDPDDADLIFAPIDAVGEPGTRIVGVGTPDSDVRDLLDGRIQRAIPADSIDHWVPIILRDHGLSPPVEMVSVDERTHSLDLPAHHLVEATPLALTVRRDGPPLEAGAMVTLRGPEGQHAIRLGPRFPLGGVIDRYDIDDASASYRRDVIRTARHLRTIDLINSVANEVEAPPGWWGPARHQWDGLLRDAAAAGGHIALGLLRRGRALTGLLSFRDGRVRAQLDEEVTELPDLLTFRAVGGRLALAGRARVTFDKGELTIDEAMHLLSPDRRADPRLPGRALEVKVGGATGSLVDVSPRGVAIRLDPAVTVGESLPIRVSEIEERPARVIHRGSGITGLRIQPRRVATFRGEPASAPEFAAITTSTTPIEPATRVVIDDGTDRELVGLLDESAAPPSIGVVIPPAWARTKESFSLLAQTIATSFLGAGSAASVLRFDYRNHRGESWGSSTGLGMELQALDFTARGAIEDIESAIAYLRARHPGIPVAVVGMSFSAPLCLRVAAMGLTDGLVLLMGGSDLQDLTRNATGGLDVVGDLRSGAATKPLNILGQYMDVTVAVADAIRERVMFLVDCQDDAAQISHDVLWVTGERDAFVDPERVRSVVDMMPRGHHMSVDCGHVPTTAAEAVTAFAPAVSYLHRLADVATDTLVVPEETAALTRMFAEFEALPAPVEPDPAHFWRRYMMGDQGLLGYEALAMTDEYGELMALQADLLLADSPAVIADIGGGVGTLLDHLRPEVPVEVVLFDLVPDLLRAAERRTVSPFVRLRTQVWDSNSADWPDEVSDADAVLLSLFLPVLDDPRRFLGDLVSRVRPGCRIVISSLVPDVDLSMRFLEMVRRAADGSLPPPPGLSAAAFVEALRDYQRNAAELMLRSETGEVRLLTAAELEELVASAGLRVDRVVRTFGNPPQGSVVVAVRSQSGTD